jgi:hypothetical protein
MKYTTYMLNNTRVLPVSKSDNLPNIVPANLSLEELAQELQNRRVTATLGRNLKGGVVSEVLEAALSDSTPVVVKYTTDWVSRDPTIVTIDKEGHNVDTQLLKYLAANTNLRVPHILNHFKDLPVTIMEDLRPAGFRLMSELLLEKSLPDNCAENIGQNLAVMQQAFSKHPEFATNESGWEIFYDRGQELRIVYPNDSSRYDALQERFTTHNQQLCAVDTHPKNMFVDQSGNMAWIDFGRSAWCDRDYALPNCLAHFVAYSLAGYIPMDACLDFIRRCVESYKQLLSVDEEVFCSYLALELLHRFAGKYITGIDSVSQKTTLLHVGLSIFDQKITTIDSLTNLLKSS